jgi:hypothetical protein
MASLPVFAQYSWIDHTGRRVFSDQPPPTDIPQKDILSERGTPTAAPATPASTASGQDSALEKKKKAADAAVAAKRQAEEQKLAAERADNCQRAKTALVGLQSGLRIAQMDAQGQRSYMTDAQRTAEIKRTQDVINSDCAEPGSQ